MMKLYYYRGVLSVAWCPQDSDLLLTAAKDNRVLCWNPNSSQPGGEVISKWFIKVVVYRKLKNLHIFWLYTSDSICKIVAFCIVE